MFEFLMTRLGKDEFNLGANIERKISVSGPYPWQEKPEVNKFAIWRLALNLFFVEFSWNYMKKIN